MNISEYTLNILLGCDEIYQSFNLSNDEANKIVTSLIKPDGKSFCAKDRGNTCISTQARFDTHPGFLGSESIAARLVQFAVTLCNGNIFTYLFGLYFLFFRITPTMVLPR